eukprot:TRINITY_DN95206_c0_g1_i1.p1 TRINITY_DN95206_c0_g1~~TRINITY_DN95206_c0_g1_i1.p1  ORF type:complete len:289 (+),score=42.43 TRINITY_DN95206_c0_g1_i1:64-930(+)
MADAIKSFVAGWIGGFGMLAVGHPFDTIKTRLQALPPPKAGEEPLFKGPVDCFMKTVKKEGVRGLYKGITAPMAGVGPVFALYFAAFDVSANAVKKAKGMDKQETLPLFWTAVCGGFTGVVGSLVLGPAELLKVRQQTAIATGADSRFFPVVRAILKEGGLPRLYTGFVSTLARDVPGSVAWFGAYEAVKMSLAEDPSKASASVLLVSGGCGGIANWIVGLPMDAVKTRIQASTQRITFTQALTGIYSDFGIKGFYRGWAPVFLRAFPANAACFACKELSLRGLDSIF